MEKYKGKIAILLACKNGEKFLNKQLVSFRQQSYSNWDLYVSDDGSEDDTKNIASKFISENSQLGFLCEGPQKGFVANFFNLICHPDIVADYYSFSDQDDIWCSNKLEIAINWLEKVDENIPAMFCSATTLIDENNNVIGSSPKYRKEPTFQNSLLQNIASGNTMVFNKKARELLAKSNISKVVAHDWTLYQIVSGCGVVKFDTKPTVLYRQHSNNVIGNGMTLINRARNFYFAHRGRTAKWNDFNKEILEGVYSSLSIKSVATFDNFFAIRNNKMHKRFILALKSGIYHQTKLGSVTTLTYLLFNKL